MDPVTGLRKTNISDPVGKALKFVQDTEPSFRVKKKVHNNNIDEDNEENSYLTGFKTRAQEIQEERQEILDSMKIKKKNFDNWFPESDSPNRANDVSYYYAVDDHGVDFAKSAESERKYEERKKKLQEKNQLLGGAPVSSPPPVPGNHPLSPSVNTPPSPAVMTTPQWKTYTETPQGELVFYCIYPL